MFGRVRARLIILLCLIAIGDGYFRTKRAKDINCVSGVGGGMGVAGGGGGGSGDAQKMIFG